jgi:hypothetical protein
MHPTIETSGHVVVGSMFGPAYVSETHVNDAHNYFGPSEHTFGEILLALRSALWLGPRVAKS